MQTKNKSKKGTLQQVGDLVNFKKYAKKWYNVLAL